MTSRILLLAAAVCAAACDEPPNAPTTPTLTVLTPIAEVWAGTLAVGSTRFYSFTVAQAGTVTVTLASLTSAPGTASPETILELGFGVPAGTGCALHQLVTARPALIPQMTRSANQGIYCVQVRDPGSLTKDMGFAIRIVHP
jgi:hypothetical protein